MEICSSFNLTLFAGTFNPIHSGHLKIAKFAMKELSLQKIIFIPSFLPPHKNCGIYQNDCGMGIVDFQHRYNMVELAIKDYPEFEVSDIEKKIDGISYTYNTIQALKEDYAGKINFIIGTDAFLNIQTWYKWKELSCKVHFLLFKRNQNKDNLKLDELKKLGFSYEIVNAPQIDISSSEIRRRVKKAEPIKELVPKAVESYIKKHSLYE